MDTYPDVGLPTRILAHSRRSPSRAHVSRLTRAPVHPPAPNAPADAGRTPGRGSRGLDDPRLELPHGSEAAKEIQQVLLVPLVELVEVMDHRVRLRRPELRVPRVLVRLDRLEQVSRPPIVQEEDALAQAPERRAAELVALGLSLDDVVGQPG